MEIGSNYGRLYSIAPGTANSPVKPQADLSFEESNKAVDQAADRVQQAKSTVENTRTAQRTAAADLYSSQQQNNAVDQYIQSYSQATGGSDNAPSSGGSLTYSDLQSLQRSANINQVATAVDNGDIPQRPSESPADRLRDRIQNIVDERPSNLPAIDIQA